MSGYGHQQPLRYASNSRNLDAVEVLIHAGAEPLASGNTGKDALLVCSTGGRIDLVRILLQRGVIVKGSRDFDHLKVALQNGHSEIADFLSKHFNN